MATKETQDLKGPIPCKDMTQLILSTTKEEFSHQMIFKDLMSLVSLSTGPNYRRDPLFQEVEILLINSLLLVLGEGLVVDSDRIISFEFWQWLLCYWIFMNIYTEFIRILAVNVEFWLISSPIDSKGLNIFCDI